MNIIANIRNPHFSQRTTVKCKPGLIGRPFQLRKPCPLPIEKLNWYSSPLPIDSSIIRFRMRLPKKTSRRCCHSTGDHPDPGWNCGPSTKRVKRTGRTKRERGRTLGVVNSHHSIDNGDESCCDTYQKWVGLISSCYDTRLRKVAICLESYSNFAICNFIFKWQVKIGMSQDFCPFFDVTGLQLITRYDIHVALRGLSWGCDYSYIKLAFAVAAVFWAYWNYNKLQFTSCENSTVALQLICNVAFFCYSVFSRLRNQKMCS